ncbi:hypothetical protein JCM17380_40210 [Desulfosporosinus burensis]
MSRRVAKVSPSPRSVSLGWWLGDTHPTPVGILWGFAALGKASTGGFRDYRIAR